MNHVKHVIPMSDSSVSIKPEDIQPTVLPDAFIQSDIVRKLNTLSLPRYDQLPNVTLYRDQVIEYVAPVSYTHLDVYKRQLQVRANNTRHRDMPHLAEIFLRTGLVNATMPVHAAIQ